MYRCLAFLSLLLGLVVPGHAITVRGRVTNTLGQPLAGARVQLIQLSGGPRNAADTISGFDGSFEILSDASGRFLLLTSPSMYARDYAPQVGNPFYGGHNDVLHMDVELNAGEITPQFSAQTALVDTPLRQLPDPPQQVGADQLLTQAGVVPELRPLLDVSIIQLGQAGTPATLFLRGAPVEKATVDGVSSEAIGGGLNLGSVTSVGLAAVASTAAIELSQGANPLYGMDAGEGVISLATASAATMHPVLTYIGDAGNLSTLRNDLAFSIVHSRGDALLEAARFNTDNDLPAARIHQVTEAANLGYYISGNTSLRLTLRNEVDASPMASPYGFYGVAPKTKLASQNLIGGFTIDTRTSRDWHNLVRYGLVRERAQAFAYLVPTTGVPVKITGANGYTASGTATFLAIPTREDAVTNRDEYSWQSDYRWKSWINIVGTARYQTERGADVTSVISDRVSREHLSFGVALSGEAKHRLFYSAAGFLDHASDSGMHGGQRAAITYVPVRPGMKKFRGTSLHGTAAAGDREPSVVETAQLGSKIDPRSRTFDAGVDQDIVPKKLELTANYFHGQYAHETEPLAFAPLRLSNALAYRTQGVEADMRYNPAPRLLLVGGYTYLSAVVERSGATPVFNPNLPGVAIGATTALLGARPFQLAPNSGFFSIAFSGTNAAMSLKATFAGKSDGTTGLLLNPTLLLPNRDLSPAYGAVDASFSYNLTHSITLFSQFTNLLDDRHIAPLGYLSTPFAVRVGVRIRVGRE